MVHESGIVNSKAIILSICTGFIAKINTKIFIIANDTDPNKYNKIAAMLAPKYDK